MINGGGQATLWGSGTVMIDENGGLPGQRKRQHRMTAVVGCRNLIDGGGRGRVGRGGRGRRGMKSRGGTNKAGKKAARHDAIVTNQLKGR